MSRYDDSMETITWSTGPNGIKYLTIYVFKNLKEALCFLSVTFKGLVFIYVYVCVCMYVCTHVCGCQTPGASVTGGCKSSDMDPGS